MTDTNYFKEKLLKEKSRIESELASVGVKDPTNPSDWKPVPEEMNLMEADQNEVADRFESYQNNEAILSDLEKRLRELDAALARVENNTFGICEVGGEEIEKERLEANPAATTCMKHMNG